MTKLLLLTAFFFLGQSTLAAEKQSCIEEVASIQSWQTPSGERLSCMMAQPVFAKALRSLCGKDLKVQSHQLRTYISARQKYRDAFDRLKAAQTSAQRQVAVLDIRRLETDWQVYGYRVEVNMILTQMTYPESRCY